MPDTEPGRWVPPATDPRRALVQLFRGYGDPFWSVTVDVDVTGLHEASRAPGGPSFFLASLFASMRAANAVPEFRRRLRPEGVWEHARVDVGSTILRGDDAFAFAYFPWSDDFPRFEEAGRREIERVEAFDGPADPRDDRDDLIHHSVLPWLDFTSFTNAHSGADDSTPKVVFGRHAARREGRAMAVAVEVHHALVDGLHVSRYVDALRSELARWG